MDTNRDVRAGTKNDMNIFAALAGQTTWAAVAREALRLARERGLSLNEDELAWSDVRDLQALVSELRSIAIPRARVPHGAHRLRLSLGCTSTPAHV